MRTAFADFFLSRISIEDIVLHLLSVRSCVIVLYIYLSVYRDYQVSATGRE